MITDGRPFDTSVYYSGGAGMFLQYHDIVKPVYLYAIINMLLTKTSFGLPLEMIQSMSILSLIEWYLKRRYVNPLRGLDPERLIDPAELDGLLQVILKNDKSLYNISPGLNIVKMMTVYRTQKMTFPVYVYTREEEPYVLEDCRNSFGSVPIRYLYGDLKTALSKCDQNFTYILSDIELFKELCGHLMGTYSHILLAREYRYNYKDNCKTLKYNLSELMDSHPPIRLGTTQAADGAQLALSFGNIMSQGGNRNASNQRT
jgi:hypothetical protein